MQRGGGGGKMPIKHKVQDFCAGQKFLRTNAEFVVDSRHNLWIPVLEGKDGIRKRKGRYLQRGIYW